jgi:hypothetical protein
MEAAHTYEVKHLSDQEITSMPGSFELRRRNQRLLVQKIDSYEGRDWVDIRKWFYSPKLDIWNPSRKGVMIPHEFCSELIKSLQAVIDSGRRVYMRSEEIEDGKGNVKAV